MVTMTCFTTKQKFEVENPPTVLLANGRYAYRCEVPWKGKNGKTLWAFKFCSAKAYAAYQALEEQPQQQTGERPDSPDTQSERPESP